MTDTSRQADSAGTWWIRIGGLLFAAGAVATLVALVPLLTNRVEPAAALWFIAVGGIGLGTAMALWGMVRSARQRSRYLADDAEV